MKTQFAGSVKSRVAELADEIAPELEAALEYVAEFGDSPMGLDFRGLAIAPTRDGTGLVAILRVGIQNIGDTPAEWGIGKAGNYVLYGYGDTIPTALAALEANLRRGETRLTWDRYGNEPEQPAKRARMARKRDSKGNPR